LQYAKLELTLFEESERREMNIEGGDRNTFFVYKGERLFIGSDKAKELALECKQKLLSKIESIEKEIAAI